ncbi:MAG: M61 family metallopeptidase [Bacteroidetes bacterium]|nr:M61 family metallopeptidase [Bacteroidota bacterium]
MKKIRLPIYLFLLFALFISKSFSADYEYTLTWLTPNTHTYVIDARVSPETDTYTHFRIPAWRPGRYYLQDFAGAISNVSAKDDKGQSLKFVKTDQNTWKVTHGKVESVTLTYHYFADNMDAGSSYLGHNQIYFNPVNLFMNVPGRYNGSVRLNIPNYPEKWKIATALRKSEGGKILEANSYHEFADSPTVISSEMKILSTTVSGVTFHIYFQGDYQGDKQTDKAAIEMVEKVAKEQGALFGGFPFKEFHLIYRLLPYSIRHAVEHENSVSFAITAGISKSPKSILSVANLTAHELFHAWNVKRIRPASLWPYDYSVPQYTNLHWFTEGVTNYYALLTSVRAGFIDEDQFLDQVASNITSMENNYAAHHISPSLSSYDSWLSNSSYKDPKTNISYYSLGQRMGLILDLALQKETDGAVSMDALFNYLKIEYYDKGMGVPEEGIQKAAEALTRSSWSDFFSQYIDGTEPIPYKDYLSVVGLKITEEESLAPGSRGIGISLAENISQGILIRQINPGGDAYLSGLGENDLILEIDGKNAKDMNLNSYVDELKKGDVINMKVFSGLQVKEIEVKYNRSFAPVKYSIERKKNLKKEQEENLKNWLKSRVND